VVRIYSIAAVDACAMPMWHHKFVIAPNSRHRRGESYAVHAKPILGGLHHEYILAPASA